MTQPQRTMHQIQDLINTENSQNATLNSMLELARQTNDSVAKKIECGNSFINNFKSWVRSELEDCEHPYLHGIPVYCSDELEESEFVILGKDDVVLYKGNLPPNQ